MKCTHQFGIIILLCIISVTIFSCGSISPKYLHKVSNYIGAERINEDQTYVFENFPTSISNLGEKPPQKTAENVSDCLWNFIGGKRDKNDSLFYRYNVSVELKSKRKVLFKLLDQSGSVIGEKTKKMKSEIAPFVSITHTDFKFYFLLNTLLIQTSAMALDKSGDLILSYEYKGGGFIVLFPIPVGTGLDTHIYKRVNQTGNDTRRNKQTP